MRYTGLFQTCTCFILGLNLFLNNRTVWCLFPLKFCKGTKRQPFPNCLFSQPENSKEPRVLIFVISAGCDFVFPVPCSQGSRFFFFLCERELSTRLYFLGLKLRILKWRRLLVSSGKKRPLRLFPSSSSESTLTSQLLFSTGLSKSSKQNLECPLISKGH